MPLEPIPLNEFMYEHLKRRFGSHSGLVEYSYNLRDALRRYDRHVDCKLFLEILEGRVPEAVRDDGTAQLSKLLG